MTKEHDWNLLLLKASALDRIIHKYQSLENNSGFYSRSWVELTEVIESEIEQLEQTGKPPDSESES